MLMFVWVEPIKDLDCLLCNAFLFCVKGCTSTCFVHRYCKDCFSFALHAFIFFLFIRILFIWKWKVGEDVVESYNNETYIINFCT